ncbi:hypothetical protein [Streptomyces sp. enrichment culture]|uniref:hypothetical protein n=1 Tax=Streptomyces sp. enrichment culture TaxID=1795815 RepID=UPI003F56EB9F
MNDDGGPGGGVLAPGDREHAAPRGPAVQEPGGEADRSPAAHGHDAGNGPEGGDPDGREEREDGGELREREDRFREAVRDPLSDSGVPGEARAAALAQRAARARFDVRGNNSVVDRSHFAHAHFGDVYLGARDGTAPVFGDVPEEELTRLRRVYRPPDGYPALRNALRERRVLVLGGPPGTGRLTTGLCLLDELTVAGAPASGGTGASATPAGGPAGGPARGRVTRLAPSDLGLLTGDPGAVAAGVPEGGGLLVRLPEAAGGWTAPQELHLDALAARLAGKDAYAVLVVSPSSPAGHLLSGRHGRACPPAPAEELLAWQLMQHLSDDAASDALARGRQILTHPLFVDALGIRPEALLPSETESLALWVARHVRGEMPRADLLDACGTVLRRQAREWFTGAADPLPPAGGGDRAAADGGTDDDGARVRQAAFRIALAVLDGEAFSAVADAAELLAQQFLSARAPGRAHGRPVFTEDVAGLLAACRAEIRHDGEELVGGVPVPVRTAAYRGAGLAASVLAEVWHRHHAARGPVVRWLRELAGDTRPQVWVRAAVAAGELATADLGYGLTSLIRPLAAARDTRRRFFAATALGQAAGREPYRGAVRAVVTDWAYAPVAPLRWTAALAIGSGRVIGDTRAALELLYDVGSRDRGAQALVASYGAARLVAGSRAGEAATLLREWADDASGERLHLAMLSAVRLFCARTDDLWQPEETAPEETPESRPAAAGAPPAGSVPGARGGGPGGAPVPGRVPGVSRGPGPRDTAERRRPAARPPVPRAPVGPTDAELARRGHWPLALAVAVVVEEAAEPLADLLWRALDSHLSTEVATEGLGMWLRAAEADAALPGRGRRTYVFERPDGAAEGERDGAAEGHRDGAATPPGDILRALLRLLPRMIRGRRDALRLRWLLAGMAEAPDEPMTGAFERHVLSATAASTHGPRGRGEEQG